MNINVNTSYTAFQAKLDSINDGLDNNKWVDNKLGVRTKNSGFVRVLKSIAGFFFGNLFSPIKADRVAFSLFKYCSQNQENLDAVNQEKIQNIYKKLGAKIKSSTRKEKVSMAALATLQLNPASKSVKNPEETKVQPQANKVQPEAKKVEVKEEPKKEDQFTQTNSTAVEETAGEPLTGLAALLQKTKLKKTQMPTTATADQPVANATDTALKTEKSKKPVANLGFDPSEALKIKLKPAAQTPVADVSKDSEPTELEKKLAKQKAALETESSS